MILCAELFHLDEKKMKAILNFDKELTNETAARPLCIGMGQV
jgi:plasmid maintenance system antidote protein VapI